MSDLLNVPQRMLNIDAGSTEAERALKALASEPRQRILELLSDHFYNVSEIAEALEMPLSTATLHINILEEAGLIRSEFQPATRGRQKVCTRAHDMILVRLARGLQLEEERYEYGMPIGAYVDCSVSPTCGLATRDDIIGLFDDPASFYEPERLQAQLIWFHHGYLEYRFPNRFPPKVTPTSLYLSMEIASEAPLHHPNWPSDITLWINQVEVGSWTSPADFGGQRGMLTPEWWQNWNSQFGQLKVWQVNEEGTSVDGMRISDVPLSALQLTDDSFISVRIGVKADARHVGGLNLFGRSFGNYPQDILLRCTYR